MIKTSVVIPVYNSRQFLQQCLDSIFAQSFSDFEVICVDDGSTDDSNELLSEYALNYPNVKVLRQQHSGQGTARNLGVTLARGEYVKFVDADDYLHPDALKVLYDAAKKTDVDITVCKAYCVNESGTQITPLKMWNHLSGSCSKSDIVNIDFFNNACSPVLWDKLVKSDIVKRCLSPSLERGQDFVTLIKYLSFSNSILFLDEKLYYYRHHSSSVMSAPESRETIMSDFITEKEAVMEISKNFRNTKSCLHYCKRIKREWDERIQKNKSLLGESDIDAIESYMKSIPIMDF